MRLISAPWIVPVTSPPLEEGAVVLAGGGVDDNDNDSTGRNDTLIDDTLIVALGTRADMRRLHPGAVEARAEGALCPALVNAHAHLELSSPDGLVPGGDGLVNWTRRLMARATAQANQLRAFAPAERGREMGAREGRVSSVPDHQGTLPASGETADAVAAAREAKRWGTAAIGDVGNGTTGWRALGLTGLQGMFFHELVGSREARTGDAMADAAAERARLADVDRPGGIPAVPAPHAPYSVGPDLMRRIFAAAAATGHATTIHLAEDADEIQLLRDGTGAWAAVLESMGVDARDRAPGLRPTAYLDRLGAFATSRPPLLVHMVHADAEDRRRAHDAGATVVLCPRSNLHIGGRLADVPALLAAGVRMAIGTDSLASVPDLSLWAEIATLAASFPDVPPRVWLSAVSTGGAAALDLPRLGSIAVGQRPGLLDVGLAGDREDPERSLIAQRKPTVRWMANA